VCVPAARKQAEEKDQSLERELSVLLIHGLLHLLGYDHQHEKEERKMRELESEYLALVGEELSIY